MVASAYAPMSLMVQPGPCQYVWNAQTVHVELNNAHLPA